MNVRKPSFYKVEFNSISSMDILITSESNPLVSERENENILLEETDKRERLLSVLLADIKWTINSELKLSYLNPYIEDCIGNDVMYLIKRIASRYLTQSSVMTCLIELEELIEMLRTSKKTQQRKLIVEALKNESNIEKLEITSSAVFDTQGNVVGIQGLCSYLI